MGPSAKSTPQEFGEALRKARSAAGVALESIAEHTKIQLRTLSALEAGNFARLPNRVFARMFLRQYLELLGRVPDEWLPAFESAWQSYEESRHLVPAQPPVPIRKRRVGPWVVGLGLVAIGVASVLLMEKKPHDGPAAVLTPTPPAVAAVPPSEPTPAPTQPPATPLPEPGVLTIRTGEAPCWVEIRIAGEKPMTRLLEAGSTWEVGAGGKGIELLLGDAGAATVEYMGEVRRPAGAPGAVVRFHIGGAPKPGAER
ncbi:MAG: hypothetical protein A2Y78_12290 [Acidobacteria bacterium RBG_13_68_16]|nr:MAG: hypothetical protein A2Y78_12290 [Acidobacteria bacterium RBG_13_68_16]